MLLVLLVGFVAGFITSISPCVLPVLPVILAGGASGAGRRRPLAIVAGLVTTFSVVLLALASILSFFDLPLDSQRYVGAALLVLLGVTLLIPAVGQWVDRPFARLGPSHQPWAGTGSGFVLGVGLGFVFAPCAGPILATITAATSNHRIGSGVVGLTVAYAAGAAVPLLVFAFLAQWITARWSVVRRRAAAVRPVAGVVMVVMAVVIFFNWAAPLQRVAPGLSAVEQHLANPLANRLQALKGEKPNTFADRQASAASALPDLGRAPNFTGITAWLNTPGDRPLSLSQLRGKVVLVDFWTYSCINCQRSLPHVEAWYRAYRRDGLVVVGVHSPEFPFEHVVANVKAAVHQLGVRYPVAVDDDLATWDAYNNEYWPAEYLIDQHGEVRHTSFGEGGYSTTEADIRALLQAGGVHHLPPPTEVPNRTPTDPTTPESYLGYERIENYEGTALVENRPATYHLASPLTPDYLTWGGTWTLHQWEVTADRDGDELELNYEADDVYLVLGGHGTVSVAVNGHHTTTLHVGGVPDLYTILAGRTDTVGTVTLTCSEGVEAYDFTFG